MQLVNKIAAVFSISTILIFYLASAGSVTINAHLVPSSTTISSVPCNWSVTPLEVNLSADPGSSATTFFNVAVSNKSADGILCNEGYIFGLFKEGEAAPFFNLSESSFYLGYFAVKTVFMSASIADDASFGVKLGVVNVTNGTSTVQIKVTLTVTDNVGKFRVFVVDADGNPIQNALVLISNATTQAVVADGVTDSNGVWQTNWLALGQYNITALKENYLQNSTFASVAKLDATNVVLALARSSQTHAPLPPPLGWGSGWRKGMLPGGAGGVQVIPTNCIVVSSEFVSLESDDNAAGVLKLKLKQGASKKEFIRIKNVCDRNYSVALDVSRLAEFIAFWENTVVTKPVVTFNLKPHQEKLVDLTFNARSGQAPDVYAREILVQSETETDVLQVLIEVTSKQVNFGVIVEIPPAFHEVRPGGVVTANFKVYNVSASGFGEPKVEMLVKNSRDEVLATKEKTLRPESYSTFTESFEIPENAPLGTYTVYARLSYGEKTAVSSAVFRVAEAKVLGLSVNALLALALVTFIAIALSFLLFKRKLKQFYSPLAEKID